MKLAVLGESSADEAAVRILCEPLLLTPVEAWSPELRSRGWPSVRAILPSIIYKLHYQTDVDALIVVVDSDTSEPHNQNHDNATTDDCRFCSLSRVVEQTVPQLRSTNRSPLKIGVGLAIPCVEAWYLCGKDGRLTEANWINGRKEGRLPYTTSELKRVAYGTERPSLIVETKVAVAEAKRLAVDLAVLTRLFPSGFGSLADTLATWR